MVSIIVPIYQVERYLERCISSILQQSYRNFELILVDDGSTDLCPEICDIWGKRDTRVKVVHKTNGGLSDARNAGLETARGDIISFIDSDDWVSKDFLEIMVATMEKNECDIVECDIIRTDVDEYKNIEEKKSAYTVKVFSAQQALEGLIQDHVFHQHVWNKIYRREILDSIFFEKGKTNEDEFWTYQVFGKANKIGKIDITLYFYFQRETSIMGRSYSIKRLDVLEAKEERQRFIENKYPALTEVAKVNLFSTCIFHGQLSLQYLSGEEQMYAKELINNISRKSRPSIKECFSVSGASKIWIIAARYFFWSTCKLKNILKKGF